MEPDRIVRAVLVLVTLLLSVAVHEYAHALAAWRLGDDTAARQGRLTLNPLAHADPLGTFLFPLLGAFMGTGVFGWGKPVPYVPGNLTRRFTLRGGEAIIAFAGPLANLIMAVLAGGLWIGLSRFGLLREGSAFAVLLPSLLSTNVVLFVFNLIPVPPLDGSKIFAWMFGYRVDRALDAIQSAGPAALLIVLVFAGSLISVPVGFLINKIVLAFHLIFA